MENNKKVKNCQEIKNMIIKGSIDHIDKNDIKRIKDHINKCETCMEYQEVINKIFNSMKLRDCKEMDIDNKIRRNLIRHVKKNRGNSWLEKIGFSINKFFQYKIPVYQSVIAFIIIFFTIYGIKNVQSQLEKNVEVKISVDSLDTYPIPVEYQYLIENLDIIGAQKKGESIIEDSSIVEYSYPIL